MKLHLSILIAFLAALLVLVGYFFEIPGLQSLQSHLLNWAVILIGISMLIGIWNLLKTHWARLNLNFEKQTPDQKETNIPRSKRRKPRTKRDIYSAFLLLGFIITFLAGLILTPSSPAFQKAVAGIQVPIETTLFALLSVVLMTSAFNFFKYNHTLMGIVFIVSVILYLILGSGALHSFAENLWMKDIIAIINQLPLAGARGILIGIAIGSLVTALRQVLGTNRAYRE